MTAAGQPADIIYLDANATTRTDPRVVEAMLPFFSGYFGNPSSKHALGGHAARAVKRGREQLQTLLGAASPQELIFTSGGTESINTAILSALEAMPRRREIITTAVEHPAVMALCAWLEKHKGIRVHVIPVDRQGRLDIAAYRAALSDRVALVSMMWANNETGVLNPVADLAELAKDVGALFHTDAVQAVGKCPIDLQSNAIDMLSLSGHKLHGPKGIGALYVRSGVAFKPQIKGGQHERGRRAGTENVPSIVGLGIAAELAAEAMADEDIRVRGLRDRLEREILAQVDHCVAVGARAERLPNTSTIAFNALGYSYAERKIRLPEAKELIETALRQAPNDPFITDSLAWVEFRMGNKDTALVLLEKAYALRSDVEIAAHLGEVLWSMGKQDRARSIWRQALAQDADNETLRATLERLQVKP